MGHLKNTISKTAILVGLLLIAVNIPGYSQPQYGNNYSSTNFWNLSLGDVILLPDKSVGWIWNKSLNKWEFTLNGGSSSSVVQYILMDPGNQFNGNPEALSTIKQPVTSVSGGSVNIRNRTDVSNVLTEWNRAAKTLYDANHNSRPQSQKRIIVSCNIKYTVVLDDIWCTFQDQPTGERMTGGISFYPQSNGAEFHVFIKGDNRFGNIFYSSHWQNISTIKTEDSEGGEITVGYTKDPPANPNFTTAKLIIDSANGSGQKSGTITAGNIEPGKASIRTEYGRICTFNYYNSVIGGSDNDDIQDSRGITINGGTIFAGAELEDVCTAIGGGGNGIGEVTINGGTVTAVTASTGTAIGGGIGWTQTGGKGIVTITNGQVYAYNLGIVREHKFNFEPQLSKKFVPATAIGGGSSFELPCDPSTIIVSGGTVFAQSVGGVAIGGGGSATMSGGSADITISGNADVTAKSINGNIEGKPIEYGSAIGGGIGGIGKGETIANGGDCTFTMTGGKLQAGSVGGGSTNDSRGNIGYAKASISGNSTDIRAQFIMAEGGSEPCSFNMSGGTIHDSDSRSTEFLLVQKEAGGAVWLADPDGVVKITGGKIENCAAGEGGAIYTTGGVVTVSNATIQSCKALSGNGGAIVVEPHEGDDSVFPTVTLSSAKINGNQAANNGGAIAVLSTGATVTLTSAEVNDNTALNNGGAFYLGDNATVEITGGYTNNNTATSKNGGAFFLSKKATATINSGTIDGNKALNGNGGAFFGNEESVITMNSGNIESNKARNGGGVYLAKGAKLVYTINDAVDGYIRDNHASQFGGGAYLAEGTTSKKTELDFIRIADATSLGFYDNTADVGADDIFAYGRGTTLFTIPKVTTMNLERYSLPGATLQWWEDYKENDNRYSDGTLQGNPESIHRYRASRDALEPIWRVPKVADYDLSNFYEKYLCLTLGFEYGDLEIRRSGLHERENAVFKIEFQGELSRPAQYVTILGEESKKIEYDGVKYNVARIGFLPLGTYKVTEVPWAWYNESSSTEATVKIQDITDEEEKIFIFQNTHKDLGTTPLHDEELKVNDLKP